MTPGRSGLTTGADIVAGDAAPSVPAPVEEPGNAAREHPPRADEPDGGAVASRPHDGPERPNGEALRPGAGRPSSAQQRSTAGPGPYSPERLARAAWSRLAEPGDQVAAAIIAHLGAIDGLAWVRSRLAQPAAWPGTDPGGGRAPGSAGRRLDTALERWAVRWPHLDPAGDLATVERAGGRLVVPDDPQWPPGVDGLGPLAPVALWVVGDGDLHGLFARSAAIVGSRMATAYGTHVTQTLGSELALEKVTVVSGGAWGIDAQAHRAAITVGGRTVAFLACGVDLRYPAGNAELLDAVAGNGALVSELAPGAQAFKARFLLRNRLIAAAATATVVVEAALRSGALSTAHRAADLARPLGAVPGPVTSPASQGCHHLLRERAAVCITSTSDALELIGGDPAPVTVPARSVAGVTLSDALAAGGAVVEQEAVAAQAHRRSREISLMLDALPLRGPRSIWHLCETAGLGIREGNRILDQLEKDGMVSRSPLGWQRSEGSGWPN